MELELAVRDIIEVGEKSVDMDSEAFGGWTYSKVIMLFPSTVQADFTLVSGDGKERLFALSDHIRKLREV